MPTTKEKCLRWRQKEVRYECISPASTSVSICFPTVESASIFDTFEKSVTHESRSPEQRFVHSQPKRAVAATRAAVSRGRCRGLVQRWKDLHKTQTRVFGQAPAPLMTEFPFNFSWTEIFTSPQDSCFLQNTSLCWTNMKARLCQMCV